MALDSLKQADRIAFLEIMIEAEREKVRRLVDSLRKLNNEVAAMVATHGDIIAQDYGRTNLECLEFRLNGSRALLKEIEEA